MSVETLSLTPFLHTCTHKDNVVVDYCSLLSDFLVYRTKRNRRWDFTPTPGVNGSARTEVDKPVFLQNTSPLFFPLVTSTSLTSAFLSHPFPFSLPNRAKRACQQASHHPLHPIFSPELATPHIPPLPFPPLRNLPKKRNLP